jgi:hypothetical protein
MNCADGDAIPVSGETRHPAAGDGCSGFGIRPRNLLERFSLILVLLSVACLAWVAATVTVEFYDGYEYILTSWALFGEHLYIFPRNVFLSAWLGPVAVAAGWFDLVSSLVPYHMAMLGLNLSGAVVIAAWIRRWTPELGWASALCCVIFNRLFFHYAIFAHSDLPSGLAVACWFWVEARFSSERAAGRLLRIAALSLVLLGRPQTAIIPVISLAVEVVMNRCSRRAAVEIAAGAAAVYCCVEAVFFSILNDVSLARGLLDNFEFLGFYLSAALADYPSATGPRSLPWWTMLGNLYRVITLPGVFLLAFGFVALRRRPRFGGALAGPMISSAAFLVFLFVGTAKEARYLAPLWPVVACLQCLALARLAAFRSSLAALVLAALFLNCSVELSHFAQPFYRANLPARLAEAVSGFSRTGTAVFLKPMAALYPPQYEFHWSDSAYYVYHWGIPAYAFHARKPARYPAWKVTFEKAGYPIPDDPRNLAARGEALVVPADRIYTADRLPREMLPVHVFRWEAAAARVDSEIVLHSMTLRLAP